MTPARPPQIIYVDARPLQDENYRLRGVGQHSVSLLGALRRFSWAGLRPRLVGIVDPKAPPLMGAHDLIFDEVRAIKRPDARSTATWFISLSPMTHDPIAVEGFLRDPRVFRVALFYDLIPLAFPERYLASQSARSNYLVCLAWLRCFDAFSVISQYSADTLVRTLRVDPAKVFVSNVAVRRELEPRPDASAVAHPERKRIVVAGGGDARKNPECVLVAHGASQLLRKLGVGLSVFGSYPEPMRDTLRAKYSAAGGRPQDLRFEPHLSDDQLHDLYRSALATVVPSRAEGFSIPIVESSAAGTPVLASDVGAHPELARDAAWRFDPDDPAALRSQLERLATDPETWLGLKRAQQDLWLDYTTEAVGERFLTGVLALAPGLDEADRGSAASPGSRVNRGAKPRIAVLSPLPPAHSGVADFTAATLRPLGAFADVHMFTPTPHASGRPEWASLQPVTGIMAGATAFDATVSVIGNSDHHLQILDFLLDHGGACIAHDARMVNFYYLLHGPRKAAEVASKELGRPVPATEVERWLHNQHELPTLFLSELHRASDPLMVHSPTTAREIARLYGRPPRILPFPGIRRPQLERLSPRERQKVRKALGVAPNTVLLVTFGIVSEDKAPLELIWALNMLRNWGVEAELVFCGRTEHLRHEIDRLVDQLGLRSRVRTFDAPVDESLYDDYLLAADIGVQLRTYGMGGLSGALGDCIAAALPTIANAHLAEAMQAPDFVVRVPDAISSLLVAEAALKLLSDNAPGDRPVDQARAFAAARTPEIYCQTLMEHLGFAVPAAATAGAHKRRR